MIQSAEAVVDVNGQFRLLGAVRVDVVRRALVTVLEELASLPDEATLLTEPVPADDWSSPEEHAASSYLQPAESS